jgi:hypothetical protein
MDLIEAKAGTAGVARRLGNGPHVDFAAGEPMALNFVEGWRGDPKGLMEVLQKAVPVYLEADAMRRASGLVGQMMLEAPRANLMDVYRALHAVPEFTAFANAMLHGFVPGPHAD